MGAETATPTITAQAKSSQTAAPVHASDAAVGTAFSNRALADQLKESAESPSESGKVCAECAEEEEGDGSETEPSWVNETNKSAFLSDLRDAVCATANEGMAGTGNTSEGCPYIEYWLSQYATRTAAQLRRAIRKFAPETERVSQRDEVIHLVASRVRRSVDKWAITGEISGLPEGVPAQMGGIGLLGGVFFRARTSAVRKAPNPVAVRAALGEGRPLPGSVRDRMEPAFGTSFHRVRLHADSTSGMLARRFDARAFAVGEHVAFAPGEYRPGTPVGDALLAHELAHVTQQSMGADSARLGSVAAFEADADRSAQTVLQNLWSESPQPHGSGLPALRSGLTLHRCGGSQPSVRSTDTGGACPQLPQVAPRPGRGTNPMDARAAGIIAIAQNQNIPLAQRSMQVVRAIICQYYPDELRKVEDVVFERHDKGDPEGAFTGIITRSVGSGATAKGILNVSRTVVESVPRFLAHEVLRVRHELDHIDQYRRGMGGKNREDEREFLAHHNEALNPEQPGTGRISAPTRINIIDAALGRYNCLSDDKQREYAEQRTALLQRRTEEQGRVRNRDDNPETDPPDSCVRH